MKQETITFKLDEEAQRRHGKTGKTQLPELFQRVEFIEEEPKSNKHQVRILTPIKGPVNLLDDKTMVFDGVAHMEEYEEIELYNYNNNLLGYCDTNKTLYIWKDGK